MMIRRRSLTQDWHIDLLKSLRDIRRLFSFQVGGSYGWYLLLAILLPGVAAAQSWIRINQVGYLPSGKKIAVFASKDPNVSLGTFTLHDAFTGEEVFRGPAGDRFGSYGPFAAGYRLDFSGWTEEGGYFLEAGGMRSPTVRIDRFSYDGTADILLRYMRQQRCGFNPYLQDSCHTEDGFIIYHPTMDSLHIDVTGGWHDASDYLQYAATSAHATAQLLFAYSRNPGSFGDTYRANGLRGSNGIPDILDEARWGLAWLEKMNPDSGVMFQQIADDRDHAGFRLPTQDPVTYGKGRERPVYTVTGEPQGIFDHTNRSTGVASTAGKFASAFALGAMVFKETDPVWADDLARKAEQAYAYGLSRPGVSQTAPCKAPYFYEEGNWVDDMQLASALLGTLRNDHGYLRQSSEFGRAEPVSPWMGADTARHYEWYPFVNLGWSVLAKEGTDEQRQESIAWMKEGIDRIAARGRSNMFQFGIPFIWCSNNLVSAMLTHLRLYREASGDESFMTMESSLLDWLFGTNPWGTSMIFGLPAWGDTPEDPHSAFTHHYGYPVDGGLVDGPVYGSIFNGLIGLHLSKPDPYAAFQSDLVVYHDDWGDYSTNEPTMDGTASLSYILSSLERDGERSGGVDPYRHAVVDQGGITRMDTTENRVYLVLTAHEFGDGGDDVREMLQQRHVRASFFFTGDFYRDGRFDGIIRKLLDDGHYMGAHSDKHLLYAPWEVRDSTLVTYDAWWSDIRQNYHEMARFGITPNEARYFMPPYEWYNRTISAWAAGAGLRLVNFTPGTFTNADYTTPSMGSQYRTSEEIESRLLSVEAQEGLNGHILLFHLGTDPGRTDKMYDRLGGIIDELRARGYTFGSFGDLN